MPMQLEIVESNRFSENKMLHQENWQCDSTPGAGSRLARNPFYMLPPETDETNRRRAPRWKRVARYPPPEKLKPTGVRNLGR